MPSTARGIIYPNEDGAANELWQHIQRLAESVDAALSDYETINNWLPAWSSSGFTGLGSGGLSEGYYQRIGDLVHAQFRIQLGTGFTVGSGIFAFNLPVPAYPFDGDGFVAVVGTWTARDNDQGGETMHYSGPIGLSGASGTAAVLYAAWSGTAPNQRVSDLFPFTPWAVNDILSGMLIYRAA